MNTIVAKKYVHIHDEKLAAGTIIPGMLVQRTSADAVIAHNRAGGPVAPLFALEDDKQGRDLDDNYASGELVQLWRPVPGEQVYAIADDNSTHDIAIGDFVESDGSGRLRKVDDELSSAGKSEFPSHIVGIALEAVSPNDDGQSRFLVEIM